MQNALLAKFSVINHPTLTADVTGSFTKAAINPATLRKRARGYFRRVAIVGEVKLSLSNNYSFPTSRHETTK